MLRVGIVDDHSIVRAGFRAMLESYGDGGLEVAFEAGSGGAVFEALVDVECDVLLLDISLPGEDGIEVLRQVRKEHQDLRVLILSGYPEDRYASALIRHGAHGYLGKDCDGQRLVQAIRTVASGKRYLSPKAAHILADHLIRDGGRQPHQLLSDRESQVFLRLARGDSVTYIAHSLDLSVKTVSTYRSRLLEKMGLASNAELASYAVRNNLIGM
ncbi:MAG: response regulator transcription factor [Thiogranum sp.]|nr:response regulator transcription factor [Thiogranum sp.]